MGVLAVALGVTVSVAVASGTKETVTVTGPPFVVDGMGNRPVGENKIELVNDSPGPHVLIVYKIPNGTTTAQLLPVSTATRRRPRVRSRWARSSRSRGTGRRRSSTSR